MKCPMCEVSVLFRKEEYDTLECIECHHSIDKIDFDYMRDLHDKLITAQSARLSIEVALVQYFNCLVELYECYPGAKITELNSRSSHTNSVICELISAEKHLKSLINE